ncbi:hypothetical protein Pmar_PMAR019748 [Perkinsus marinus ATCC 50983]|uniref:Uncharacterized protein n=1 Tax=Perkinsus marinus (strain ATCC 50983 / TXsc) TaxID=423536 RepID=C5LW30_PERM5|nr:hypothetical protein Pmar_PMAR019748 [Perkinsus marinus ATCC 50983]EEQ99100.1 hypothetical protein Pmar_PMAR019748 [Perkinsus marinus ATCC 50983]|eukprot:XP_002766383.1 hypothetical protein Pmar_PMAR019748 [Perkinsus marinus ATCC 50983]
MAVLYPQTARGLVGVDITKPAGENDKKGYGSTLLEGLGLDHPSDVMELQLAVHALELENAALKRRAKERSRTLAEAQKKVQSLEEALREAELSNTRSTATDGSMTTYGVVSESLRKVVGLLTEAGQQLHRPKECGALLIEAAEGIAAIDESMRRKVMSSGGRERGVDDDSSSKKVKTLEVEVEDLRKKLAEAERMITSSHAREFDLVIIAACVKADSSFSS